MNYYNEFDPSAIAWLKELISAGAIPDGHIDTRSIVDVQPEDLDGFDQCHFFAGIGGWPYALELAGYANVKGLWTGSCPCQPFSAAGKRKGTADARHLWPEMFRLVKACRPQYVLGEQVEAAIRLGWLDGVFGDLEGEGYAVGAAVLGAHSVGAPHIRQRLYWGAARLANLPERRWLERAAYACGCAEGVGSEGEFGRTPERGDVGDGLGDPESGGRARECLRSNGDEAVGVAQADTAGGLEHAAREQVGIPGQPREQRDAGGVAEPQCDASEPGRVADEPKEGDGATGQRAPVESRRRGNVSSSRLGDPDDPRPQGYGSVFGERAGELSPWSASTVIPCADGKTRRISVEPALFPLAHGVPGRVGLLRGAGNAIVPQVAALFITSFMESIECSQRSLVSQ